MRPTRWFGWHFLPANRILRWNGDRPIEAGQTVTSKGKLILCKNGLHASRDILDALDYAPGPVLSRVELHGERLDESDKSVASFRTHLWVADITRELHLFACWCAEQALAPLDAPDPRSVRAIHVKRLWLDGRATDVEIAAARAAARAASSAAYWAASSAAYCAASSAASSTAYWAASKAAYWAASSAASRNNQRTELMQLVRSAGYTGDDE